MEAARILTVAITGGNGQLGSAFRRLVEPAIILNREQLDLSTPAQIEPALRRIRPALLINCAGFTAVDRAEVEPEMSRLVNATAVVEMARVCRVLNTRFVTFSTDYVFSGKGATPYVESDLTQPVNLYGLTKLAGEQGAITEYERTLVIRTSWVISATHENFVFKVLERASEGQTKVVDDQRGCATVADDLARGAWNVIQNDVSGILHLTNRTELSWYELAQAAAKLAAIDPKRISPCSSNEFPTPAARPSYSVLASERPAEEAIAAIPDLSQSLPSVVRGWTDWRQPRSSSSRR